MTGRSETRNTSPMVSSEISSAMLDGIAVGRASRLTVARMVSTMPPSSRTPTRLTLEVDPDLGVDRLGQGDPNEIEMRDVAPEGMALHLTGQGGDLGPVDVECDDGVETCLGVEDLVQFPAVHGHRGGLRLASVDDAGDDAGPAHAARFGAAEGGADFCFEFGVGHGGTPTGRPGTA